VDLGCSGSFRVRAGVKTSLVTDSVGTVASSATVPSSLDGTGRLDGTAAARLRYRLDGMVASAIRISKISFTENSEL